MNPNALLFASFLWIGYSSPSRLWVLEVFVLLLFLLLLYLVGCSGVGFSPSFFWGVVLSPRFITRPSVVLYFLIGWVGGWVANGSATLSLSPLPPPV